ncbi:MAG: bacteriohopanetetrol glucosamine biosynthesis glycosyltransferase HpnI [Rhodospirillales bacterium]
MQMLRYVTVLPTAFGAAQAVAGFAAVRAFAGRRARPASIAAPVTILKPVCGDENLLEEAISSFCVQQYPCYQLVIGAQDPDDPALEVARRLQRRFADCDITIVIDPTWHGSNRKIANLINMLPFAKHDLLVFADSDLHVRPDYLTRVVDALQEPGTGLVTTLYGGEPAVDGSAAQLGASHISHTFLPGALLAVALGRQDNLGVTMALRRHTLEQVGGLCGLVEHLADDAVLGRKVRELGMAVRLADTIPMVTVQERSLGSLWLHEMRWARTSGSMAPRAFAASVLQFPLFWALVGLLMSGGARWAELCYVAAWVVRGAVVHGIDRELRARCPRPPRRTPFWLLPVRDVLSTVQVVVSYWSDVVVWRGHRMRADHGVLGPMVPAAEALDT